jgi:hypothetical protein
VDHAEVQELLELAAVEPHGLDRLVAGDTAVAAAVAGHLAGCQECTLELARLRRASVVIREVVRTTPSVDLRARTLAFVGAVGRDRSAAASAGGSASPGGSIAPQAVGDADRRSGSVIAFPGRGSTHWLLSLAAVVAISVVATAAIVNGRLDAALAERDVAIADQQESIDDLAKVSKWTLRVSGEPDAQRVALASATGGEASGTVLFSRSTKELVVVVTGLSEPPSAQQLRCWVSTDGERTVVGQMFFSADLAYWVGEVSALQAVEDGASFGVSLADATQPDDPGGEPVISGEL